jgi:hypothetical protein
MKMHFHFVAGQRESKFKKSIFCFTQIQVNFFSKKWAEFFIFSKNSFAGGKKENGERILGRGAWAFYLFVQRAPSAGLLHWCELKQRVGKEANANERFCFVWFCRGKAAENKRNGQRLELLRATLAGGGVRAAGALGAHGASRRALPADARPGRPSRPPQRTPQRREYTHCMQTHFIPAQLLQKETDKKIRALFPDE